MTIQRKISFMTILGLLLLLSAAESLFSLPVYHGRVVDQFGEPVYGASVSMLVNGGMVSGCSTEADGSFNLPVQLVDGASATLRVSSLGYMQRMLVLDSASFQHPVTITLAPQEIRLGQITVASTKQADGSGHVITHHRLEQEARQSVMTTNPLSSLKEPQLARRGSSQSSTLRINGTSPQYFINGISMGADPNHYGLFSILPISVVDRIEFSPQGTSAAFGSPSVVALETPAPFNTKQGNLYLSMLEGTGSYSYGTSRFFALWSMRQSIVDLIDDKLGETENGTRIPATHFRDLFSSVGYKFSETHLLFVDGYDVRDNMKYERPPDGAQSGIASYIESRQDYIGIRDQLMLGGKVMLHSGVAYANRDEHYVVGGWHGEPSDVRGKLAEETDILNSHIAIDIVSTDRKLSVGGESEVILSRRTDLAQQNWNFLPPDAATDNPFIYTPELNELYGDYHDQTAAQNHAVYFSLTQQFGRLTVESGVRGQYFSELKHQSAVSLRQRFVLDLGRQTSTELFLGTFAENPVNRVLEPYQVLVRANADELEPISSYLGSLSVRKGGVRSSLFIKEISRYPVLTPDFSKIDQSGSMPIAENGFIDMRPSGNLEFAGFDISADLPNLFNRHIDLYTYYGYTRAIKQVRGVSIPYDLSAPHRFLIETIWHTSKALTFGATFQIRTGYPHSPDHSDYLSIATGAEDQYTESYFLDYLRTENTDRFPVNATLNLHCSLELGKTSIYGTINNVTNRSNPVVYTGSSYVYDLGLFPSIGISTSF